MKNVLYDPTSLNHVVVSGRWEIIDGIGINNQAVHDYCDLIADWIVGYMSRKYVCVPYKREPYEWFSPETAVTVKYHTSRFDDKFFMRHGMTRIESEKHIIEAFVAITFANEEDAAACRRIIAYLPNPSI